MIDLGDDINGNITSSDKLKTPRTIAFSGDATGSASFDGSANVTIPVVVVDNSHAHDLGNSSITGNLSTDRLSDPYYVTAGINKVSIPLFDILRADRTAFLPADQIIIEKSTDAGVTWVDAEYSDSIKRQLFTGQRPSIAIPQKNGQKSCDCMIRITITVMKYNVPVGTEETDRYSYWNSTNLISSERYISMSDGWVWLSSSADRLYMKVEKATAASSNNWSLEREAFTAGWAGGNYFSLNILHFGGAASQYCNLRFTFRTCTTSNNFVDALLNQTYITQSQVVQHIKITGKNIWSYSNNYMYNDHLYSWDENKNVIFPSYIKIGNYPDTDSATSYFFEKNSDGFLRKKTLANVKSEIVTSAAVISALGFTPINPIRSTITDFNTALTEGEYSVAGTLTNGPYASGYGKLRVYVNDGGTHNNSTNWLWQYFDDTSGRTFFRSKINSDSFSVWYKVWKENTDGSGSGLDADKVDGYETSLTATANTIAVRDVNGYLYSTWFNAGNSASSTAASNYFYDSGDGFLRKKSLASVRTELVTSNAITTALGFTPLSNNSPVLTGTPLAPTAPIGTQTTQIATTQFVQTAIASITGGSSTPTLIDVDVTADTDFHSIDFTNNNIHLTAYADPSAFSKEVWVQPVLPPIGTSRYLILDTVSDGGGATGNLYVMLVVTIGQSIDSIPLGVQHRYVYRITNLDNNEVICEPISI